MATEQPIVATEPTTKGAAKATKFKKAKKPSAPMTKDAPLHPQYFEMIKDTIVSLKERNSSSVQAISKFIEEKYKNIPANYKKLLLNRRNKETAAGKLVKKPKTAVKKPAAKKAPTKKKVAASAPKAKAPAKLKAKAKAKAPAAKAKEALVQKAKPFAKPKAASAPKANPTAKSKAAAKPKTPTKPVAKSAKTSTRSTPGRTAAAPKSASIPAVKKTPAKKPAVPKKQRHRKGRNEREC
ncbi:unnamed protein product [Lactuca virosa]|uniref:H15 domain-containing protein n=1 Tax=Lactuca virosa TaxID=75947 RepID=A0AAU9MNJ2_9ASTR|nr:unnamed protein product [Lactuca virosa]